MINGVLGDGHNTVVPHSQGAQVITSMHHQPQPVQPILKVENSQPNIKQIMVILFDQLRSPFHPKFLAATSDFPAATAAATPQSSCSTAGTAAGGETCRNPGAYSPWNPTGCFIGKFDEEFAQFYEIQSPAPVGGAPGGPRMITPRQPRPIAPGGPAGGGQPAPPLTEEEQKNVHKCKNFLMTLIQLAQERIQTSKFSLSPSSFFLDLRKSAIRQMIKKK